MCDPFFLNFLGGEGWYKVFEFIVNYKNFPDVKLVAVFDSVGNLVEDENGEIADVLIPLYEAPIQSETAIPVKKKDRGVGINPFTAEDVKAIYGWF